MEEEVTVDNVADRAETINEVGPEKDDGLPEALPFDPVGDTIFVEFIEREQVTDSGIFITGGQKTRPTDCVVVGSGSAALVTGRSDRITGEALPDRRPVRGDVVRVLRHHLVAFPLGEDEREVQLTSPDGIVGFG